MEKHGSSEYDQKRWRRGIGGFVARHFFKGDDSVVILRGRTAEASQQAGDVLLGALDAETAQAVRDAEAFLVAVDGGEAPVSLFSEPLRVCISSTDVSVAVHRWAALNEDSLQALREDAETCRRYRNDVSTDGLFEFCLTLKRAEESLRDSLWPLFDSGFTI